MFCKLYISWVNLLLFRYTHWFLIHWQPFKEWKGETNLYKLILYFVVIEIIHWKIFLDWIFFNLLLGLGTQEEITKLVIYWLGWLTVIQFQYQFFLSCTRPIRKCLVNTVFLSKFHFMLANSSIFYSLIIHF